MGITNRTALIKSIQRGTISLAATSATATITAVDTANTVLRLLGFNDNNAADNIPDASPRIALTNSTTVTATKFSAGAGSTTIVSFEVVEYYPGVVKQVQRGTISLSSAASNTATITSTDVSRTELSCLGMEIASITTQKEWAYLALTNATTVTATRTSTGAPATLIGYQAVEYYL